MPIDESQFLNGLEIEVELEIAEVRASHSARQFELPPSEWLFDPADIEREEIGLGSLLGAVEALQRGDRRPDADPGE